VTGRVVVVGLGPAGPELCTSATLEAIERVPTRFVRTMRHPSVAVLGPDVVSFDDAYEQAASFDEVYRRVVEDLVAAAEEHGEILYAVPGSPRVAERSVDMLCADPRVETEVVPALSFLDLAWVRLGVDPLADGVRIVDGRTFATEAAGSTGPLLVAQCDSRHVLSEIKLSVEDPPDRPVIVLQRLGLADERRVEVPWEELDRVVDPDHLTSLYIPALRAPVAAEFVRFDEQVRILRAECPWDAAQNHDSLRRHLLEETYEVLEAIDAVVAADEAGDDARLDDAYAHLE
jgi:tetrapyrrole methylase family protein/MazG family protein